MLSLCVSLLTYFAALFTPPQTGVNHLPKPFCADSSHPLHCHIRCGSCLDPNFSLFMAKCASASYVSYLLDPRLCEQLPVDVRSGVPAAPMQPTVHTSISSSGRAQPPTTSSTDWLNPAMVPNAFNSTTTTPTHAFLFLSLVSPSPCLFCRFEKSHTVE